MQEIVFASNNQGKITEMQDILFDFNVLGLQDVFNESVDIVEDGSTFKENALIKARFVYAHTGKSVIADDSGIVVDGMNGMPGVESARFMGKDTDYKIKNQAIIDSVKDSVKTCRYVCAIAYIDQDGNETIVEETMEGLVNSRLDGENGFGYDPIFYFEPLQMTAARMSKELKNKYSHRAKAVAKVINLIREGK